MHALLSGARIGSCSRGGNEGERLHRQSLPTPQWRGPGHLCLRPWQPLSPASNPIYAGRIRHRDQVYDGEHQAVIPIDVFERVQQLLVNQAPARRSPTNQSEPHLLRALWFDEAGERLRPVHANKKGGATVTMSPNSWLMVAAMESTAGALPAHELKSLVEHPTESDPQRQGATC